jgi:hypothetical protein
MVLWLPFRSVGKKRVGGRQTNGTFKQTNWFLSIWPFEEKHYFQVFHCLCTGTAAPTTATLPTP